MNNKQKHINEKRFNDLFKTHFKYVFSYVLNRVNSLQDAEDVTAEAFASLWDNIEQLDNNRNAKGWIYRVAVNKLNDLLRKKYKLDFVVDIDVERIPDVLQDEYQNTKGKAYQGILMSLINKLEPAEQEFIRLKYKQGLTNRQIAKDLGMKIGTVKVRNNRLLKKLTKLWQKYDNKK